MYRPMDGQTIGQMGQQMDQWMDGETNRWNFFPFYWTLSSMQAAALLPIEASQKQQGKGTANRMMPLGNWFRGNVESSLI